MAVGGSFEYRVRFPDPGLYWYHPHTREDRLPELGLYGNFIVDARDRAYFPPVNTSLPVVLDDIFWKIVDQGSGKANLDIDWHFRRGDMVKLRVWNDPNALHPMQHPIHFHGQRFLVLAANGVPNRDLVWKDTALVQTGDTVDFLVEMSNPGAWMVHCHIAEHLQSGMMFGFRVEKRALSNDT